MLPSCGHIEKKLVVDSIIYGYQKKLVKWKKSTGTRNIFLV